MKSNVLKFAQQGLWPTLSGGWYYDPSHSDFTNIFHLYTWLILLCLPFVIYQSTQITWTVTAIYTVVLIVLMAIIKLINAHLHQTFDDGEQMQKKTEPIEEIVKPDEPNVPNEARVHFDSLDADFGHQSANECSEKQDAFEATTDAGHLQLWEEISRQDFSPIDLFSSMNEEKEKRKKTHVDVHTHTGIKHKPSSSKKDTSLEKGQLPSRRKGMSLDVCYSLPDVSSSASEGHVTMKDQEQSSSSSSLDSPIDLEDTIKHPPLLDDQPYRIQRKAGFRNRPRPKRYLSKASHSSNERDKNSAVDPASGDGLVQMDGSRGRNAPAHDALAPDHKRSFSSTSVEVFQLHCDETGDVINEREEMNKRSSSLPAASGAGDSLALSYKQTLLRHSKEDKTAHSDPSDLPAAEKDDDGLNLVRQEPNDNRSLSSLSPLSSLSGISATEPTSAGHNHTPPGVNSGSGPRQRKTSKTSEGSTKLKKLEKENNEMTSKPPSSKARSKLRESMTSRKITVNDFISESSASMQHGPERREQKRPQVDQEQPIWMKYVMDTSSSDGEDQILKFANSMWQSRKSEVDGPSIPLLADQTAPEPSLRASAKSSDMNRNKKVTYKSSSQRSRKSDRKGVPHSSSEDSEAQSAVEENFQQCLQNFNDMSTIERRRIARPSRAYHSRPANVTTRHVTASRSRSAEHPIPSRRPPGTRHRHPAGQPKLEGDLSQTGPRRRNTDSGGSRPDDAASTSLSEQQKLHLAHDHADTTEGAVHTFQDEHGNWMTYTFSNEGAGVAVELSGHRDIVTGSLVQSHNSTSRVRVDSSSSASNREPRSTSDAGDYPDFPWQPRTDSTGTEVRERFSSRRNRMRVPEQQSLFDALRRSIDTGQRVGQLNTDTSPSSIMSQLDLGVRAPTPKVKVFYKVKILPSKTVTIQYDRLALMDLLDRNLLPIEAIISILLVALVGFLGVQVLAQNLLFDLWTFWFCVVIATSQFCLIRSVQPDSASPTHGHNRVIAYSRPFYFTICVSLLLLFNYLANDKNVKLDGIQIYGVTFFDNAGCAMGRDFMLVFTLLLPIIFMFGLLPQVNTFIMYICEQVEIHAFGGSASTSLTASAMSITRSLLCILFLYGFCYGAMIAEHGSKHILYSAFCGILTSLSYHLSRQISSPWIIWKLIKSKLPTSSNDGDAVETADDPAKVADNVGSNCAVAAVSARLQSDVIICPVIAVLMFAIHCSTAFTALQPSLSTILYIAVGFVGTILHYFLPQARKNLPWLLFSRPLLKSKQHDMFEVKEEAQLMWFERFYAIACFIERNILFPLLVVNELTREAHVITKLYGAGLGCAILTVIGLKSLRSSFSIPEVQYFVFSLSILFVRYDARSYNPSALITFFFFAILFSKFQDLVLKLHFWMVYVAPWQISWGSAVHAFAQPFAVPHTAFLASHAILSSLLQAPFVPFLGSALFLASYARPLKFWERNYNTKRIDHSNTRLSSQLDRGPHSDDNNLNSIFYEHLTYSLQKTLAGDVSLGRWGNVYAGDCFILASDNLNALVHVIEVANGLLTFQLRGLEFSGTYCQQREVEAINEDSDKSSSCCCCSAPRIKGMLSFNSAFNHRWLAWQVTVKNYVLDGYSISDNNATIMLGVFDLRKILISYIIKSIIFFLVSHDSLPSWLDDVTIRQHMEGCEHHNYVDTDSTFALALDDDYDSALYGISRSSFQEVYNPWVSYCAERKAKQSGKNLDHGSNSKLITLCFAMSVLGRRSLNTASHNLSSNLDAFLHGLHSLFKGDFRIMSPKDEWIFADMNLLREVLAPGVRTALKLHQDHFVSLGSEEYDQPEMLYDAINDYANNMVITHEGDPVWRKAVLSNTPSLLALRRVTSDTFVDQYSVVTLNHRSLGFRIVKVNRECVRGLWAGQQNELVYLRNRNPERGSIQNAKQVLRNMINSSCDQPIGYPIYVSPLTSSFANTNQQLTDVLFGPITFKSVKNFATRFVACLRQSCSGSCNSGGSAGLPMQQSVPLQPLSISRISSNRSGQYQTSIARHSSQQRSLQVSTKPPTPPAGGDKDSVLYVTSQFSASDRQAPRTNPAARLRHSSTVSGEIRAKRLSSTRGSDPTKLSNRGSDPFKPSSHGSDPTKSSSRGSDPTKSSNHGSDPFKPSSHGSDPTESSSRCLDPTKSSNRGSDPFKPSSHGSDPTKSSSRGSDPFKPSSHGADPTKSSSRGSDPFKPSSHGLDPTESSSRGLDPTKSSNRGSDPFKPSSRGSDPTKSSSRGSDPFKPSSHGLDPTESSSRGLDPTKSSNRGSDMFKPSSHGSDPTKSSSRGSDPFKPSSHGADPFKPSSHSSDPTKSSSHGSVPFKPSSHGSDPTESSSHSSDPTKSSNRGSDPTNIGSEPARRPSSSHAPTLMSDW